MVTMEDISIEVGCSINTVSKALNNKPDVSKEMRKKILDAAKRLGYVPNYLAKSLVTRTSGTIGIIVPDVTNPLYMEIFEAIAERAARMNYSTFLAASSYSDKLESQIIETLCQKRVDGFIIAPSSPRPVSHEILTRLNLPAVYVLDDVQMPDVCFVGIDMRVCAQNATRHLIEAGCKNIALLSCVPSDNPPSAIGYRSALEQYGLRVKESNVIQPDQAASSRATGHQLGRRLGNQLRSFDGIVLENDLMFAGVYEVMECADLRCPEDIRVAACISTSFSADWRIPITAHDIDFAQMGADALNLLTDRLHPDAQQVARKIIGDARLIARASSRR